MYILSRGEVPGHPRWLRFARHDRWGARHDTNNPSLRTERSVVKQSLVLGVASLTLAMTGGALAMTPTTRHCERNAV